MPKKVPNYAESCIYKLCCKNTLVKDVYVGSTTSFRKRKNQHKTACSNEKGKQYNYRVYSHIRSNGGWDNWDMIEVAKVKATDKRDLERVERTYIESLGATLNCSVPTRSAKERYIQNRPEKLEYEKRMYEKNKALKLARQKKYYERHRQEKLDYQKQYHESHKEHRQAYNKKYQAANKHRIMRKVTCECGAVVAHKNLRRHKGTQKHLLAMHDE